MTAAALAGIIGTTGMPDYTDRTPTADEWREARQVATRLILARIGASRDVLDDEINSINSLEPGDRALIIAALAEFGWFLLKVNAPRDEGDEVARSKMLELAEAIEQQLCKADEEQL